MGERVCHLEVSRDMAASAEAVYDAIADVTRMGEWSPECRSCSWIDGATGPAVGARFVGDNSNNGNEWSVTNTVTAAEPGREFRFDCEGRGIVFASWGYAIESTDAGCRVTETWDDHRPAEWLETPSISGVVDRVAYNRQSMAATLAAVAAAVES